MTQGEFMRLDCTGNTLAEVDIRPYRRIGNTTRIADNAIKLLFEGKKILVRDHYYINESRERTDIGHKYLFDKILRRVKLEHPGLKLLFHLPTFTMMIDHDK
jgi:DNA topoisomerase VI subunit A